MASERGERDDWEDGSLAGVAAGAVTFLTLAVAFGLMFLGVPWFWVAFPVGFGGLLPLAVSLAKWYESSGATKRTRASDLPGSRGRSDDTDEALSALRDRYTRGEIDDEEFETRVERLLETESVDDAEEFLGGAGEGSERGRERRERDRTGSEGGRTSRERDEVERA